MFVADAGAVAIGTVGLGTAKAAHDESLGERKQLHELSPEEKKELKKLAPVREEYAADSGVFALVGKDVDAAVGVRVRMREGLISHGVGTITALCGDDDPEQAGCCEVVWDSNQAHTRSLHVKLGNMHLCRVGKEGHFDLLLADTTMCADLTIVKHDLVLQGRSRNYLEVVRNCEEEAVTVPEVHNASNAKEMVRGAAAQSTAAAGVGRGDGGDGGGGQVDEECADSS